MMTNTFLATMACALTVVAGARLTRYDFSNPDSCYSDPFSSDIVFTILLPDMIFLGEKGNLDAIVAVVSPEAVKAGANLTVGIWRINDNGSFTLRQLPVQALLTRAGLLNVTTFDVPRVALTKGDYFGVTFSVTYAVCQNVSEVPINATIISRTSFAGPAPQVNETFSAQTISIYSIFAIAADVSEESLTTTAVTTSVSNLTTATFGPNDPSLLTSNTAPREFTAQSMMVTSAFVSTTTTPASVGLPGPRGNRGNPGLYIPDGVTSLCETPGNPCNSNSTCEQTILGVRCICTVGYKNFNATTCEDIDECSIDSFTKCQQSCRNYPGGYACGCRSGFSLAEDDHHCVEKNMCTSVSDTCEKNFTCHSAGGYRQCIPASIRVSTSPASVTTGKTSVALQTTTWLSDVWIIIFIVWSGLLSILAVVLIAWMAREMRQTKTAIEMEALYEARLHDSCSLASGSTLRHGTRFHGGTFTPMETL